MKDLVKIRDLSVRFYTYEGIVQAVDRLDLDIRRGETLGIVGETGSGKTMTALAVLRLIPYPGRIESGKVLFTMDNSGGETDLLSLQEDKMRSLRGSRMAMVFQEPGSALNPVFTIGDQIAEVYLLHRRQELGYRAMQEVEGLLQNEVGGFTAVKWPFWRWQRRLYYKVAHEANAVEPKVVGRMPFLNRLLWRLQKEAELLTVAMLRDVEIPDAARVYRRYPHELSGGMKQRAVIAMALACSPQLLIADEPTTSLDVTIQAQILDLFQRIKKEKGSSILYITHNLGVAATICDRVAVMYAGRLCEVAGVEEIFLNPLHPYTRALLEAVPRPGEEPQPIPGSLPDPMHLPAGCAFHPRCASALPICSEAIPQLKEVSPDHFVACYLY